ncbi:MAG: DUF1513 domain-containing protein [Pseudomonadota bacterium]
MIVARRRQLLQSLGIAALGHLFGEEAVASRIEDSGFLTAFQKDEGAFFAGVLDRSGSLTASVRLPMRGHEVIHQPNTRDEGRLALVFARRPGTVALQFSIASGKPVKVFHCPKNRHFYGHGVFSPDGKLLFATENDFENARGVVGVYEAKNAFRRVGELFSGGVGPHDIGIDTTGRRLIVANGGIETHPDFGRTKLNLATMRSNLSLIDVQTLEMLTTVETPSIAQKISLRHFITDKHGQIWLAGQSQNQNDYSLPLIWCWSQRRGLRSAGLSDNQNRLLDGYVGAIAYNSSSDLLAVSSPKSGHVLMMRAKDNVVVKTVPMHEACGIAPQGKGFLVSSLNGSLLGRMGERLHQDVLWDNHASPIP